MDPTPRSLATSLPLATPLRSAVPRKKNSAWLWFFVFVVCASVGVAGFMIWFNLRMQLTAEKLEAAIGRWKEHGPADYRMTYTRRFGEGGEPDTFTVTVRNKKVVEVRMNGAPLRDKDGIAIVDERLQYHRMDRLLSDIERLLQNDAREGKKNYNVAIFDEHTGALRRFVRSERSPRRHVEEEVKIEPLANE
jgi:hypothetical protein